MLDLKTIYSDVVNDIRNMSDTQFLNEVLKVKLDWCTSFSDDSSSYKVNVLTGKSTDDDQSNLKGSYKGALAA